MVKPTVFEKPVKSLERWYNGDLKDTVRVGEVRRQAVEGLKSIAVLNQAN